ncbi:oxaloacetate decarboxylase subunit beta [Salmonella enterica subsp. enterica]|uniref:Oxaloacetate decarboxylase subunit beta n=1 Tax=Salmonella enterica I TaxID=59201 RepID=A0A3S4JAD2_SALET|nr:oxaloacetate decarboxylase subunit beta [Salmonella enterica subsp. enterica]
MAKLLNLCSKNKNQPAYRFGGGVGGADGSPRIEQSGAGVGPAELPADARDGPERGGGYRFGYCGGVMLKYVLAM